MLDKLRQLIEEFEAIYVASLRFRVAYWATLGIPSGVMVLSFLIPDIQPHSIADSAEKGLFDGLRILAPWLVIVSLFSFGSAAIRVYIKERRRLLYL